MRFQSGEVCRPADNIDLTIMSVANLLLCSSIQIECAELTNNSVFFDVPLDEQQKLTKLVPYFRDDVQLLHWLFQESLKEAGIPFDFPRVLHVHGSDRYFCAVERCKRLDAANSRR